MLDFRASSLVRMLLASVLLTAGASCSDESTESTTESDASSSVDNQTVGSKTRDRSGDNKEDVEEETADSERAGDDEKKSDDAAKPSGNDEDDKGKAAASDDETKLDNPDAPVDLPAGFKYRVLSNGLEVYSARDTSTANVSVQVWYKVGSKDDPAGRSGFAHLFEHLMFKATRNLPSETIDRLTEDVG
ncbi:MAG TPA: insulinase family protein, partial [Polyangiales bacterium]|nr:insulinase family protein [Polyangiales bacterium]